MKNIQVIDGATNCVYDVFSSSEAEFRLLFPEGSEDRARNMTEMECDHFMEAYRGELFGI